MNKVIPINNNNDDIIEEIPTYSITSGGITVPYNELNIVHSNDIITTSEQNDGYNSVTSSVDSNVDTPKNNIFDSPSSSPNLFSFNLSQMPKQKKKSKVQYVLNKHQLWLMSTFEQTNIVDKSFLKLVKKSWFNMLLWISVGLIISEIILISIPHTLMIQIILLSISTFLFVFVYIILMITIYALEYDLESPSSNKSINLKSTIKQALISVKQSSYSDILKSFCKIFKKAFVYETWIELFFLIIGWSLIYNNTPIAGFRIFRILRYVWYSEYYISDRTKPIYFFILFYSHLVLQYIENIRKELFTTKSKGAMVVFALLFFVSYIFAIIYYQISYDWILLSSGLPNSCDSIQHCFITMIRISIYDGTGIDYIVTVFDKGHTMLGIILFLYMIISAMILLNGLIGIFGSAFESVSQEQFSDIESNTDISDNTNDINSKLDDIRKMLIINKK